MTKDEALSLALEALERVNVVDDDCDILAPSLADVVVEAITAIKAALEAKDETHAYGYAKRLAEAIWSKHYKTTAPQWEPFDELIGVLTQIDNMTAGLISPPQRKPLTDEEIWKFWWNKPEVPEGEDDSMEAQFVAACLRAIEAAHGIKGEA
jgi:hypothetical protein